MYENIIKINIKKGGAIIKNLKFVFFMSLIIVLLSVVFYKTTNSNPYEVEWVTYKMIFSHYNNFSFDEPIDTQILQNHYDGETIVALHNLELSRYNIDRARKFILNSGQQLYGYDSSIIIKELDRIYIVHAKYSVLIAYVLYTFRWILIFTVIELFRSIYKKFFEKI